MLIHYLETLPRLLKYLLKSSIWVHCWIILEHARKQGFINKTGIMLGLGEKNHEVFEFIECAAQAQVDILTIGQYLQPSSEHHSVERYYSPKEFAEFARFAQEQGISHCESGPLVRSSWHAQDQFERLT